MKAACTVWAGAKDPKGSDLSAFIEKGEIILQEQDLESYALLKGVDETVDLSYALKKIGSTYLTNERQFYVENYPGLIIEKARIDDLMEYMIKGETV